MTTWIKQNWTTQKFRFYTFFSLMICKENCKETKSNKRVWEVTFMDCAGLDPSSTLSRCTYYVVGLLNGLFVPFLLWSPASVLVPYTSCCYLYCYEFNVFCLGGQTKFPCYLLYYMCPESYPNEYKVCSYWESFCHICQVHWVPAVE